MKIQDFQPTIKHLPGKFNVVADALSRAPVGNPEKEEYKEVMDPPTHILLALDSTFGSSISGGKLKSEQSADPSKLAFTR